MSHLVTIKTQIKDLAALDAAAKAVGLELRRGQETFRWWGTNPETCTHALSIPNSKSGAEIGVVKDGAHFKLIYDFYGSQGDRIRELVGEKCGKLVQAYNTEVITRTAKLVGKKVVRKVLPNGTVKLEIRGY